MPFLASNNTVEFMHPIEMKVIKVKISQSARSNHPADWFGCAWVS
jgi:hypothetical protein